MGWKTLSSSRSDSPISEVQMQEFQPTGQGSHMDETHNLSTIVPVDQADVLATPSGSALGDNISHGHLTANPIPIPTSSHGRDVNGITPTSVDSGAGGGNRPVNNDQQVISSKDSRYSLLVPHAPSGVLGLSELDVASGKVADPPITLLWQETLQFVCMLTFVTQISVFRFSYSQTSEEDPNCVELIPNGDGKVQGKVPNNYQNLLKALTVVNSGLACAGILTSILLRRIRYLHGWFGILGLTRIGVHLTLIMWCCCALTIGFSTTSSSPWLYCSTRWAAVNLFSCVPLPLLLGCIALRYHRIKSMRRSDHDREVEKQATHEAEALWYILRFNGFFLVPVFASGILGGRLIPYFNNSNDNYKSVHPDFSMIVYFVEAILLCFFFFFRYFQRDGATFFNSHIRKSTLVVCTGLLYCTVTIVCIAVTYHEKLNSSFTEAVGFAALLPIMVTIVDNLLTSNEL